MKLLSIIIPIDVSSKQKEYLIKRLKRNIEFFNNFNNIEIIVIDSSKNALFQKKIESIVRQNKSKYFYGKNNRIYSAAKSRNLGVLNSSGKYILFFDVDLIIDKYFIKTLFYDIEKINKQKNRFFIYPCLYLSENFSKKIENESNINFKEIKDSYLKGENDKVLYLAVNTSTILVNRKHFINIGMYDEDFKGHGYEDFELIHRLYINYINFKIENDYLEDYKTYFPAKYKGFRKYFAYIALENFFRDMFTLHLWHPRPLANKYYKIRQKNQKLFLKKLEFDLEKLKQKNLNKGLLELPDYERFVEDLLRKYGYDKSIYYGLFKYTNNYLPSKHNSIKRKIRKFFLNPFDFFKDSYKNWIKKLS